MQATSSVVGDSISKSFEFILSNQINDCDLQDFIPITILIEINDKCVDFVQLDYSSNYNSEYKIYNIRNSDSLLNYSNYYI